MKNSSSSFTPNSSVNFIKEKSKDSKKSHISQKIITRKIPIHPFLPTPL
jgi:hypothetical protein